MPVTNLNGFVTRSSSSDMLLGRVSWKETLLCNLDVSQAGVTGCRVEELRGGSGWRAGRYVEVEARGLPNDAYVSRASRGAPSSYDDDGGRKTLKTNVHTICVLHSCWPCGPHKRLACRLRAASWLSR